jgi:hypothetical protein
MPGDASEDLASAAWESSIRCRDRNSVRFVALKFLPDELSRETIALQRFRSERAASALKHANICASRNRDRLFTQTPEATAASCPPSEGEETANTGGAMNTRPEATPEAADDRQRAGAREQETLEQAQERADNAERELSRLKQIAGADKRDRTENSVSELDGIQELRKDAMMAHLLDSLEGRKDIGHYGRLVFAMVGSRFLPEQEVIDWLAKDPDCPREKASAMLRQVEGRGYNPPRRERILQWQAEQDFPIVPDPGDPDCGNVYKSLKFTHQVYDHIENYQMEKAEASS